MPFVPVPSTAMVELFFRWDNQRVENTLYFRQAEAYGEAELTTLANEVIAWATAEYLTLISNQVTLIGVKATSLESDTAPAIEVSANVVGAAPSPALPNNNSLAVKFLTAGRGRSSRGRNYWVGLTENDVANNTVHPAVVAAIIAAYQALLDPPTITEGAWSVVSRFQNGVERNPGIAQLVTGVQVTDAIVDSQRRRLPGRGT